MIKINEVIVVEGKYDKIRLSSIIEAIIIPTDGFGIFKDKEKIFMLRKLAEKKGLLILTDSDAAGFMIRNYLSGCIDKKYLRHVYIPEILGKEKRKSEPSKEGLLGVEGMPSDVIKNALEKAGILCSSEIPEMPKREITRLDFFEDGLNGSVDSKDKRNILLKHLGLPQRLSQSAMLEVFNSIMDYSVYKKLVQELLH